MALDVSEAPLLLTEVHEEVGARFQEGDGIRIPRHYGDPAREYRAAVDACGMVDRSNRKRWRIEGRDPAAMLEGILTNAIPPPARDVGVDGRVRAGHAPYGLTLTPKGKLVSDHRLFHLGGTEENSFLLDLPAAGASGMEAHFRRFLPPRYARAEDVTGSTGMVTVIGPVAAASLLSGLRDLGARLEETDLDALEEGEFVEIDRAEGGAEAVAVPDPGPDSGSESGSPAGSEGGPRATTVPTGKSGDPDRSDAPLRVVRSGDLGAPGAGAPPTFDLIGPRATLAAFWRGRVEAGCAPVGLAAWETLRIEGGRPQFGVDMDEDTLPVEAGVHDRAIDYEKGCYTGQEVIVRIRDRGRVNRHLRRLLFGELPAPERGTPLQREDGERTVGAVTSAAESPRFGQVIGLGYVRREVEPPARVRLGKADGPVVEVREL